LLFALIPFAGIAQKKFDFNNNCKAAYREIISLKLVKGQSMLDAEKKSNPDNLIPYFLENYIDFFILFFNEDPAEYKKRLPKREQRLELISKGPENSPFFLFTKSVIHFQWASIRVKFGYTWDAGWEFRRSFLQAKENLSSFPSFSPSFLYSGAMQVTVGTIPDGYKWLTSLFGIKGDIKTGMKKLEGFLHSKDEWSLLFHEEAVFYYCYMKFYIENDKEGVFRFIDEQQLDVRDNHLFAYLASNLRINNQQSELALRIMTERNLSPEYLNTPVWDLETGYAKLNHLEPDAAMYFERFVKNFKGRFYAKDALQKLSWHYYLAGDQAKADECRRLILTKNGSESEADKLAQKEAKTSVWPDKLLLRARLLNDGGYYREALRILHGRSAADFNSIEHKLEFSYRVGRLYDDTERDEEAVVYYKQAVRLGESRKEHYGARAALQLGLIYEKQKNLPLAAEWFKRCLAMKDHDFKNSIDQRAKAGIERIGGEGVKE
jgi:tetratricopeptide (TPR) repeat protein